MVVMLASLPWLSAPFVVDAQCKSVIRCRLGGLAFEGPQLGNPPHVFTDVFVCQR